MYTQFRPFSGVSLISLVLITCPTAASCVWRIGASVSTFTVCSNSACGQLEVQIEPLLGIEMQVLAAYGLKSGRSRRHRIVSDLQRGKNKDAAVVGLGLQSQTGIDVRSSDLGVRNYRAGGVLHNTCNGALIGLS
jgi:hypothetical protein